MQNQNISLRNAVRSALRNLFFLIFAAALVAPVQAQSLDQQCEEFVDINDDAEELLLEIDDLNTMVMDFMEVDDWQNDSKETMALGRKDELTRTRTGWNYCKDSLAKISADWYRLKHLAVKGTKMAKQYKKGSKLLEKVQGLMVEGAIVFAQGIDELPVKERQKILLKSLKGVDKMQNLMNDFTKLTLLIDSVCQDCNDSPEDHE